jgi:sugar O-acyltransferase (sialic acid O-acetyltransferase NeuD family)
VRVAEDIVGGARDVVIAGAGNLGKLLFDCLDGDVRWNVVGFIDDGRAGQTHLGIPIFGSDGYDRSLTSCAFLAIGYPTMRGAMLERLRGLDLDWCTYIDRRSVVGRGASIGRGTIVLNFATIASGVRIGEFTYVSSYAHLGAGAEVGSCSSIMPGACIGTARVGDRCIVGLHSACLDEAVVGDDAAVAPGALVRGIVPPHAFVANAPARIARRIVARNDEVQATAFEVRRAAL